MLLVMHRAIKPVVQPLLVARGEVDDDVRRGRERGQNFKVHGDLDGVLSGDKGVALLNPGGKLQLSVRSVQKLMNLACACRLVGSRADLDDGDARRGESQTRAELLDVLGAKTSTEFDETNGFARSIKVWRKGVSTGQI